MRREDGSVTHWIHEIQNQNEEAAQELWQRYFQRLVALARKELGGTALRVADEEDVALSVFNAFWRTAEDGRFPDLSDRDGLWRLLVKMTVNKVIDQQRKQTRQKRGGGKLRGESVFENPNNDYGNIAQVIGEEPTPEFLAIMSEQIKKILSAVDDKELQSLALLKMEGYTNKELAEQKNCSERTIERRMILIRAKIEEST